MTPRPDVAAALSGGLHVEQVGPEGAPVLLLLHGGGVAGWMWRPVFDALSRTHRVVVPDLPGHGRSAHVPFTSYAAITEALVEVLRPFSGRPCAAIGFSMGAQLLVSLLARAPQALTSAMVVSALAAPIRWEPAWSLPLYGAMVPLMRMRTLMRPLVRMGFPPDLVEDALEAQATITASTMTALMRENRAFRLPPGLSATTTRVLAVAGAKEPAVVARSARALAGSVAHGEVRVLEGVGHDWPLRHREAFLAATREWLERTG